MYTLTASLSRRSYFLPDVPFLTALIPLPGRQWEIQRLSLRSVSDSINVRICLVKAERRGLRRLSTDANVGKLAAH